MGSWLGKGPAKGGGKWQRGRRGVGRLGTRAKGKGRERPGNRQCTNGTEHCQGKAVRAPSLSMLLLSAQCFLDKVHCPPTPDEFKATSTPPLLPPAGWVGFSGGLGGWV